jgi:diguanylate cyclase
VLTTAQYKSGEIIIRENDQGETAYVIETGRVEVTKDLQGKNIHLTYLYPGETFGEMSMIDDKPRSATVTAADDTEVPCYSARSIFRDAQQQSRGGPEAAQNGF